MRFTTDAFLEGHGNPYLLIGFGLVFIVLVGGVIAGAIGEHFEKKGRPFSDTVGGWTGFAFFILFIVAIIFMITGFVHENNVEKDLGLAVAVDLVEAGYSSPMNIDIGSLHTGNDTTFDHIKNDEVVSCLLVGMKEPSEFKVVCID